MYNSNYLAKQLRAASVGRESKLFADTLDGRVLSYGEMFSQAEKVACVLIKAGVRPGDRVAAQLEKSIESVQLYLGTVLAGGVFLPLNMAYTQSELEYFISDAEPTVIVTDPENLDTLQNITNKVGHGVVLTLSSGGAGSLIDALPTESVNFEEVARGEQDLAAILYTSGTTGRSKGAMLSHSNLASNALTLKDFWCFTEDDVLIHALPIFHTHGLFVAINTTLCAGSSMKFMQRFDADRVLALMSNSTVLMGVPTFYVRLLESPSLHKDTVKNMRLFISGSAPLLAETHKLWSKVTESVILERYGMTETNMNTSNPYIGVRRAGTVGFPLPGVQVRITDSDTGKVLGQDEIGSIEVRGPNVFNGYWRMPEKTAEEFREDKFFISGDIGVIDVEGYLSIVGRSKDLIITGGYNVYPKEVELLIDDIEGVFESAVVGVPHSDFGEGVIAIVVKDRGSRLLETDVFEVLKQSLARYKQPKAVFITDELPRNTMGKVLKNRLRDKYKHYFSSSND